MENEEKIFSEVTALREGVEKSYNPKFSENPSRFQAILRGLVPIKPFSFKF